MVLWPLSILAMFFHAANPTQHDEPRLDQTHPAFYRVAWWVGLLQSAAKSKLNGVSAYPTPNNTENGHRRDHTRFNRATPGSLDYKDPTTKSEPIGYFWTYR